MAHHSDRPERPRLEPEIIPPAHSRREPGWQHDVWEPGIYVARFGTFGLAMLMLIVGFLAAVILLAVVGAILVWIPILALLVGAGVIYRLLRR